MPLNTLRLNHQKSSHPNDRIVFIKPLPRPASDQASYDLADTFLRAIAAQCLPLMKNHFLSVTTLEEYEPNREFIGRNFNNGEIIQLVLQSKNGGWVPFNMVQMVMMHELAHNSHMNHGKAFWKTRNIYAEEMKALWTKGYTGEGFWGSGRTLADMGNVMGNNILSSEELEGLPLCGGTYRSRHKRKRKAAKDATELTWREKRDRRIEKKFGKNGVSLGEDEDQRLRLEIQRKGPIGGKPRVAQSKRGRELRAAAALARFETNKQEVAGLQRQTEQEAEDEMDETEDYYEDVDDADVDLEDATDADGRKMLDSHGQGMVRICGHEDTDDTDVRRELQDLNTLDGYFKMFTTAATATVAEKENAGNRGGGGVKDTGGEEEGGKAAQFTTRPRGSPESDMSHDNQSQPQQDIPKGPNRQTELHSQKASKSSTVGIAPEMEPIITTIGGKQTTELKHSDGSASPSRASPPPPPPRTSSGVISCPVCSLDNPRDHGLNATCLACAHVLDPSKDPRSWACRSQACQASSTAYLNAGDVGLCGLCGQRRSD